ncbi:MAG TPA: phosphate ABC transporter substrate-binding protein PstS [Armatimonadota bacterium]|nr:phosphate ABC transporter substrate-binding protein PstS [Armatimonadota bacterium]
MNTRLAFALLTATLCAAAGKPATAQQLTGAGAPFPFPIYSKWFDAYHRANPGVTINYQSIGSGGGIQQLKNRTVDFGASDAPLSDAEVKQMPAPVAHIPTVAGAVVLAYNLPGAPNGIKLTGDVIGDIFLGKITRWNDARIAALNRGVSLPGRAIAVAHRSDGSGTTYIFTHYLAAVSPAWKSKVGAGKSVNWPVGLGGKGNEGVAGLIRQTPGGFGYVELAYAIQNRLPFAQVRNRSGRFIAPDVKSTTAAVAGAAGLLKGDIRTPIVNSPSPAAYPICGLTYLLVYRNMPDAAKGGTLVKFLRWAMGPGQALADDLHYAPLPKQVVSLNSATLKSLTAGGRKLAAK